jgi:hypothetical protein
MTIKELIEKEDTFHLAIFEALGCLVLMNHWQRGIIDLLIQRERIQIPKDERENWDRVINNLQNYEEQVWEIVPSRLMTTALREYRKTGVIDKEHLDLMLKKDTHGRIPYKLSHQDLDDLEDILRRLKDSRQTAYGHGFELTGGTDD